MPTIRRLKMKCVSFFIFCVAENTASSGLAARLRVGKSADGTENEEDLVEQERGLDQDDHTDAQNRMAEDGMTHAIMRTVLENFHKTVMQPLVEESKARIDVALKDADAKLESDQEQINQEISLAETKIAEMQSSLDENLRRKQTQVAELKNLLQQQLQNYTETMSRVKEMLGTSVQESKTELQSVHQYLAEQREAVLAEIGEVGDGEEDENATNFTNITTEANMTAADPSVSANVTAGGSESEANLTAGGAGSANVTMNNITGDNSTGLETLELGGDENEEGDTPAQVFLETANSDISSFGKSGAEFLQVADGALENADHTLSENYATENPSSLIPDSTSLLRTKVARILEGGKKKIVRTAQQKVLSVKNMMKLRTNKASGRTTARLHGGNEKLHTTKMKSKSIKAAMSSPVIDPDTQEEAKSFAEKAGDAINAHILAEVDEYTKGLRDEVLSMVQEVGEQLHQRTLAIHDTVESARDNFEDAGMAANAEVSADLQSETETAQNLGDSQSNLQTAVAESTLSNQNDFGIYSTSTSTPQPVLFLQLDTANKKEIENRKSNKEKEDEFFEAERSESQSSTTVDLQSTDASAEDHGTRVNMRGNGEQQFQSDLEDQLDLVKSASDAVSKAAKEAAEVAGEEYTGAIGEGATNSTAGSSSPDEEETSPSEEEDTDEAEQE
ncbi:unnamed protein product [Amoebophrya sp. A120]|nr:unnamed protein product [Amoebophrya sp. A120]|eukprot:GSA120T00002685001.1